MEHGGIWVGGECVGKMEGDSGVVVWMWVCGCGCVDEREQGRVWRVS